MGAMTEQSISIPIESKIFWCPHSLLCNGYWVRYFLLQVKAHHSLQTSAEAKTCVDPLHHMCLWAYCLNSKHRNNLPFLTCYNLHYIVQAFWNTVRDPTLVACSQLSNNETSESLTWPQLKMPSKLAVSLKQISTPLH